jgi:hypothetical protein
MNHIYAIVRMSSGQQSQVVPETARQRRGGPSASRTGIAAAVVALVLGGGTASVMAGPGPVRGGAGGCPEIGVITVSDARTVMCELITGDQLTVTSTGTIDGVNNGIQIGDPVTGTDTGIQIINNGTVDSTAGFNAVRNYGAITLIENNNLLTGLDGGIVNSGLIDVVTNTAGGEIIGRNIAGILNFNTIPEINNAGLIQGGANGYGIDNPGIINELNNSGTITGGLGAILNTRDLFILNNSGSLLGNVVTADTTLNLSGTAARISGAVTNTDGSVNLLTGASFTTENTFSSGTFSIASGATLRVNASGHTITVTSGTADAFNNAGTLRVGEGVTAQVNGNYTQSGGLRIGAASNANHGRLNVSGNAVLTSAATFTVDVNATNTLANGQTLEGVVSASGTLSNSAPSTNVSDNSALFNFTSRTDGNAVDLDIVAVGSPAPAPAPAPAPSPSPSPSPAPAPSPSPAPAPAPREGIVPAVIDNNLLNGVPTAQVLDSYIRGGRTGTDWDNVVTALGQLPTNRSVAEAVGQAMPSMHGNAAQVVLSHGASSGSAIEEQMSLAGRSGGSQAGGNGLWVKPVGNWVDQDGRDGVSGFEVGTYGLVGGIQKDLNASSTLGFGLAYLKSSVDGQDFAASHSSDIESAQLIGYGRYAFNDAGWHLSWQGDYTRSTIESQRAMGFIGRIAQAKHDGDAWHLGLGVSRTMAMGQGTVSPGVALDWRRFKGDGYTETGAGALNLQAASQSAEEAILKMGAQMAQDINARTQWLVRGAVGYDLASQDRGVTTRFTGGGVSFTTDGLPRSRAVVELGLGMRFRPAENMELIARYELRLRKGLNDQSATVRLGWAF